MHIFSIFSLALLAIANASSLTERRGSEQKPPVFFLAGDSTTAIQSEDGGGWGDGFLTTLANGAVGTNFGHNGATTVTFVEGGDWAVILDLVKNYQSEYRPYVTIQVSSFDRIPTFRDE